MEPSEAGPFGGGGARERSKKYPQGVLSGADFAPTMPPYWMYPPGLSYCYAVCTVGLLRNAAGAQT